MISQAALASYYAEMAARHAGAARNPMLAADGTLSAYGSALALVGFWANGDDNHIQRIWLNPERTVIALFGRVHRWNGQHLVVGKGCWCEVRKGERIGYLYIRPEWSAETVVARLEGFLARFK